MPSPGRLVRWLPSLAVLACVVAVLFRFGTALLDIVRYAGYAGWAVLLPGVLVYRALRRVPHSLVDDLAMGAALGLALEIGAYVLFSATGLRGLLWLWPLLVVLPFSLLRPLRRHWRPVGYQRASLSWSWAVAAVALAVLGYLTFVTLRPTQPLPTTAPKLYFIDQLWLLSLVGEAKHHFPLQVPQVVGEPLAYHWFSFAHMASASMISGVDPAVVFFRFFLPTVCLLAVVLLAVVGWRVSGRPWVGAVATALMFAVGELVVGSIAPGPLGGIVAFTVWTSPSVPYGWLMLFPMIALALDRLTGGLPDAPIGRGAWPLLAIFAVAALGGKATGVPVTLCAVGLVALVELVRRRPARTTWTLIALLLAAYLFAAAAVFRFTAEGTQLRPFGIFWVQLAGAQNEPWWREVGLYSAVLGGYLIYLLTRFAGIPVLAWIGRRSWGTVEWFLLGGAVGGTVATLVLWHLALSQNFFVRSGFAFGAILSAMGMVALIERHRVPARVVAMIVTAVATVCALTSLLIWQAGGGAGAPGYHPMASGLATLLPIYRAGLAVAAVALAVAVAGWLARRRWPRMRGIAAVAVLALLLSAGLPGLAWDAALYPNARTDFHTLVSPEQVAGARWLRANSDPDDLVATNVHCVSPPPAPCWHLSFWLSAYAERRILVESWAYSSRATIAAAQSGISLTVVPFGDSQLLATNEAAFYAPDAAVITRLRGTGVRWLVVDRQFGRESSALSEYADLRWEKGTIAIYRLRPA